jgi:hypothetical protein
VRKGNFRPVDPPLFETAEKRTNGIDDREFQ